MGNPQWSLDEAIILLDAVIAVQSEKKTRHNAVIEVSYELRSRARSQKIEITESFRSVSGIDLQMQGMEYLYTEEKKGRESCVNSLFRMTCALYKKRRAFYNALSQKVKKTCQPPCKELFIAWLPSVLRGDKVQTAKDHLYLLDRAWSAYSDCSLRWYDVVNPKTVRIAREKIAKSPAHKRIVDDLLALYYQFLKAQASDKGEVDAADYRAKLIKKFGGTYPTSCSYKGEPLQNTKKWKELYVFFAKRLIQDYPQVFAKYVNKSFRSHSSKIDLANQTRLNELRRAARIQVNPSLYLEFDYDELTAVELILLLRDMCKLEKGDFTVRFSKIDASTNSTEATPKRLSLERPIKRKPAPEAASHKNELFVLNFRNPEAVERTKPVSCSLCGEEIELQKKSWGPLYLTLLKRLYAKNSSPFEPYVNKPFGKKFLLVDARHKNRLTLAKEFTSDLYLEVCHSAPRIVKKIEFWLKVVGLTTDSVQIQFKPSNSAKTSSSSKRAPSTGSKSTSRGKKLPPMLRSSQWTSDEPAKSVRDAFEAWMASKEFTPSTITVYANRISQCATLVCDNGLSDQNLWLIDNCEELDRIRTDLFQNTEFVTRNEITNNSLSASFNKYVDFRAYNTNGVNNQTLPVPLAQDEDEQSSPVVPANKEDESSVSADQNDEELGKRYATILEKYFKENGYQLGKLLSKRKFCNAYFEVYGEELDISSFDGIEQILKQIGSVRDNRVFPSNNEEQNQLIDEIIADIQSVFESGISVAYIEKIFEVYRNKLGATLQIYTPDALTPVLINRSKGSLIKCHGYLTNDGTFGTLANDIQRVMESFHEPQTFDTIAQILRFVPEIRAKQLLANNQSIVSGGQETFFYAHNLPVDSKDLQNIVKAIKDELEYRPFLPGAEIVDLIDQKCPYVELNSNVYSALCVRNSLAVLLKDEFSFIGPIVSHYGQAFDTKEVFAYYAKEHESFTLADLETLAKDLNTTIYWESVLQESIRVSATELVRKDQIHFNVEEADAVLENFCPDEFAPIISVDLFLQFPNIGRPWNKFLLESYLFAYSRQFKLINASIMKDDVRGAIVRRDSVINDIDSLLVQALLKSDNALNSRDEAEDFIIDNGYMKRRMKAKFDAIYVQAKNKAYEIKRREGR